MKKWPSKWFWLTLGVPVCILLFLIAKPLLVQVAGQTVMIQTEPYDPRNLFYGDYVQLNYTISHVSQQQVDPAITKQKRGFFTDELPVYVSLVPRGEFYAAGYVSLKKPSQGLFLRGRIYPYRSEGVYTISYPIERYYVPEGTGRQLEKWAQRGSLLVQLKVFDGYAIITGVKRGPVF